jgi:hypothetical protein
MTRRVFVGVDLSLTGCGLVAVPDLWDLEWSRVRSLTVGEPLAADAPALQRIERLRSLSHVAVTFCRRHGATDVWFEAYPIGAGKMLPALHLLAELGGLLRVRLFEELGIVAHASPIASARKLILGRLPQKGAKERVAQALWDSGARFSTVDEADAFAAANWGLHESEFPCLYQGDA